jgi:hypothetical protein
MISRVLSFLTVSGLILASACSGGGGATSSSALPSTTTQSNGGVATWQSLDSKNVADPHAFAAFAFAVQDHSYLLVTSNNLSTNLFLGNHLGQPISATIAVSGVTGTFTYSEPTCGSTPATVRLFFESSGKYAPTNYWWADAPTASYVLANTNGALVAPYAMLNATTDAWSDLNGQPSSANVAAFNAAASHIAEVGLSFGGGCYFENGVGTTDGSGIFTLNRFDDGTRL